MKLANITVQPIVEMVHPYCLPEDALPQATPEAMAPHRHWLEPWFLCPEMGQFIMAIQSWLVRTEHHNDDQDYGYDAEYGMGGDACIHNMARYVAVAPRNVSTSLRYLDFEV